MWDTEGLIRTSLQSCCLEDNAQLLQNFKHSKPAIQGLKAVLQHLLCLEPMKNMYQMRSHMPFDEAFEIFNSFHENMGFSSSEQQHFLTFLLHPTYGLRVSVVHDCDGRLHPENMNEDGCNCRNKADYPRRGQCLATNVVYQAKVPEPNKDPKIYIGMAETKFKTRFNNHKLSIKHIRNTQTKQYFQNASGIWRKTNVNIKLNGLL